MSAAEDESEAALAAPLDAGAAAQEEQEEARELYGEDGFLDDITQLYLNEIGATPLLSPEEELALARARAPATLRRASG